MGRPRDPLRPVVPHPTDPSFALGELTQGYYATISAVDAPAVGQSNWFVWNSPGARTKYAIRRIGRPGKHQTTESLHRFIARAMELDTKSKTDHENGNGLDCRRSNLRSATNSQNAHNSRRSRNNSTGVKGVSRHRTRPHSPERYVARVMVQSRSIYLGTFDTIDEAARVVRAARVKLHGAYANHGSN